MPPGRATPNRPRAARRVLDELGEVAARGVEERSHARAARATTAPESRVDRSASSIRLTGRVETTIRIASRSVAAGGRRTGPRAAPRWRGADRELFEQLVEQLDRRRALADPGGRARSSPARSRRPGEPAGLQADRRGEPDHLLERLALLGRDLGPRQPRVEQERQVLLVLLLELLDHRLAEPRGGPPVDPARAVAGPVVAQAVILLLLRERSCRWPRGSRSPALEQVPAPGELAHRRIHRIRSSRHRHRARVRAGRTGERLTSSRAGTGTCPRFGAVPCQRTRAIVARPARAEEDPGAGRCGARDACGRPARARPR